MADKEYNFTDEINVTGLSQHHQDWKTMRVGDTVQLKHDPANRYDKNATGVFTISGRQIGWIPKAKNAKFAEVCAKSPKDGREHFFKITRNNYNGASTALEDYQDLIYIKHMTSPYTANRESSYSAYDYSAPTTFYTPQPTKGNKMANFNSLLTKNSTLAKSAAFLEAGRIANAQATKLASKHLPLMVRGYADTPAGRLVLANAAIYAANQFRPNDARLARLADAMAVSAYQELIQSFDVEKMINDMLSNETIKAALSKVDVAE
jgi:hypothetical protein